MLRLSRQWAGQTSGNPGTRRPSQARVSPRGEQPSAPSQLLCLTLEHGLCLATEPSKCSQVDRGAAFEIVLN